MTMTTASLVAPVQDVGVGNDDPAPKPTRRRFSEKYKADIIAEYDQATDRGAKGAILRREGLYSSQVLEWKLAIEASAPRAAKSKRRANLEKEIDRLKKRNERLEDQLTKHKQVLEIQGKTSELLARLLAESEDDETRQQP
jgi:transposase-like protein